MKNMQTALAAITVGNGYANTLNAVELQATCTIPGHTLPPPTPIIRRPSPRVPPP